MIQLMSNGDMCDIDINGMWSYGVMREDAEELLRLLADHLNQGLVRMPQPIAFSEGDHSHRLQEIEMRVGNVEYGLDNRIIESENRVRDEIPNNWKINDLENRIKDLEQVREAEKRLVGSGKRILQLDSE